MLSCDQANGQKHDGTSTQLNYLIELFTTNLLFVFRDLSSSEITDVPVGIFMNFTKLQNL